MTREEFLEALEQKSPGLARFIRRWATERPRTPVRSLGVDEIYLGRRDK